jgi:hypothetical protein
MEIERGRKREKERERGKEKEREKNGQNEESGHLHLAVLIFSCSKQILNKRRFQRRKKRQKYFFSYIGHNSAKNLDNHYW